MTSENDSPWIREIRVYSGDVHHDECNTWSGIYVVRYRGGCVLIYMGDVCCTPGRRSVWYVTVNRVEELNVKRKERCDGFE